mmetsp:Transcript_30498/g.74184  ORF Transcript_30498/g.74184 Transcript_30498/m.74184 type:complete len:329 (+) Transcript_30498:700-1686(+)
MDALVESLGLVHRQNLSSDLVDLNHRFDRPTPPALQQVGRADGPRVEEYRGVVAALLNQVLEMVGLLLELEHAASVGHPRPRCLREASGAAHLWEHRLGRARDRRQLWAEGEADGLRQVLVLVRAVLEVHNRGARYVNPGGQFVLRVIFRGGHEDFKLAGADDEERTVRVALHDDVRVRHEGDVRHQQREERHRARLNLAEDLHPRDEWPVGDDRQLNAQRGGELLQQVGLFLWPSAAENVVIVREYAVANEEGHVLAPHVIAHLPELPLHLPCADINGIDGRGDSTEEIRLHRNAETSNKRLEDRLPRRTRLDGCTQPDGDGNPPMH